MTAIYTTAQAAQRLGITADTVRSLIRAGRIQARAINPRAKRKTYRITEGALTRYEQTATV